MTRRRPGSLRTSRRSTQGQVVPIFALIAVVLFAATGLAVDAGLAYFTYNGSERAAASAALAGVPYMPNGLPTGTNTSTTCVGTAGAAACAATARDGLANGSTVNGHPVTVTVARYPSGCGAVGSPCADNKLTVQVTAWVQPTFLHVLGFGDHQVTATDTAFFLPPISLGQPGAQLGSSIDQLGTGGTNYYFLRSEGYGNDRTEGDAYDPYNTKVNISCNSGVTETPAANTGTSTDVHTLSASLGTDVSDSTLTGAGFNKLPLAGGYDFSLTVPSTVAAGYGMVYNPAFAPDGGFNPAGGSYNMHEQDGSFSGNTYTDQYSAMEYTLFQVNDRFDHSSDTPLSQVIVDPLNVTISGGAPTSFVDVANGKTLPAGVFNYVLNNVYHKWVDVGMPPAASTAWTSGGVNYNIFHVAKQLAAGSLAPGSYRLRADMLDYKGLRPADDAGASQCSRAHKGYAIQLATSTSAPCADPGCQVSALDELAVYTPIITAGSSGFSIPLFQLPADYAGQTINFYIFDVGDVSGTNSISIQNPDTVSCGGSPAPCLFTTSTGVKVYDLGASRSTSLTGNMLSPNGTADACASPAVQPDGTQALVNTTPIGGGCPGRPSNFFNGRWLLFQLQIPSNYTGAAGAYWLLHYSLSSGTASDTFTIAVNYANSPVHLL
jgi:hypothetical protein